MARRDRADRRNIIIAILLPLLFIAVAVIVIGIFLFSHQNVAPVFRITYLARAVHADITAMYRVEGENSAHFFKSVEGEDGISFDANDPPESVKNLIMTEDIDLVEGKSNFVLFTYTFTNKNRGRSLRITMNDDAHKENVSVLYATSNEISGDIYEETLRTIRAMNNSTSPLSVTCPKATEEANTEMTIYVLVSISDPLADALYETTDDTPFTFSLESF